MVPFEAARSGDPDQLERFLRWSRYILGIVGTVGGWALALTVWLVTIRAEVNQLKDGDIPAVHREQDQLRTTIGRIDDQGTRALDIIRSRQNDVLATNQSQDARIREMEMKLSELQRQQTESRFWIDQLVQSFRSFAHPSGQPVPNPPFNRPP